MVKTQKIKKNNSGRSGSDFENEELLTPKQKELIKQRDDIEELTLKHFSVEQIAVMLNLSLRTVGRRMAERREENLQNFLAWDKKKREEKMAEFEAELRMIKRKLWSIHASAEVNKDKVSAISAVMDAMNQEVKIKQILGYLPKDKQDFEDTQPLTVIWGSMPRPDRAKQIAEQYEPEEKLHK